MKKFIFALLLISCMYSCKKEYKVLEVVKDIDPISISEKAMTQILSKEYTGRTTGKSQNNFNDTFQTIILNDAATINFKKYEDTSQPQRNGIKLSVEENEYHDMLLLDSNLIEKFLVFSNGRGSLAQQLPLADYTDRYMSETIGPEAVLYYYYEIDSIVYFRNYTSSTGGGSPHSMYRYYKVSHLK